MNWSVTWPFMRVLFGLLFLASAILKLIPIEYFELIVVDQVGISWGMAPYFSRGLVLLEGGLGLFLLFGFHLRYSIWFSLLLLAAFQVFLIAQITSGNAAEDCGCFGELLPMNGTASLVKNFAFMVIASLLLWRLEEARKLGLPWLAPLLFVAAVPILLYAMPLPDYDPNADFTLDLALLESLPFDPALEPMHQGDKTVVMMLSNCVHCAQLASLISKLEHEEVVRNLRIVVVGSPKAADFFITETGIQNFELALTENRDLIGAIDGTFPTVLKMESGVVTKKWKGNDVNIRLLTSLLGLE